MAKVSLNDDGELEIVDGPYNLFVTVNDSTKNIDLEIETPDYFSVVELDEPAARQLHAWLGAWIEKRGENGD